MGVYGDLDVWVKGRRESDVESARVVCAARDKRINARADRFCERVHRRLLAHDFAVRPWYLKQIDVLAHSGFETQSLRSVVKVMEEKLVEMPLGEKLSHVSIETKTRLGFEWSHVNVKYNM